MRAYGFITGLASWPYRMGGKRGREGKRANRPAKGQALQVGHDEDCQKDAPRPPGSGNEVLQPRAPVDVERAVRRVGDYGGGGRDEDAEEEP